MGAWGAKPWENDAAADWLGDLFKETRLAKRVEQALRLDIQDYHEEIRAAAFLVRALGRVHIWPVELLDQHRALAAARLEAILEAGVFEENAEFIDAIRAEVAELRDQETD